MYDRDVVSFNTRKALCVQLGEPAGKEIADLLARLAQRVDTVEQTKVDVTPLVPGRNLMPAHR